ncbi:MAG: class I SAM-dependent methyltransferase [Nitrososphaerota archaeon]|nr:class I SAM-dependent methyltransferase [Nitrososphaerota archaeon]
MTQYQKNDNRECCSQFQTKDRRFPSFLFDNPLRRFFLSPDRKIKKFVKQGDIVADLGSGPGFYTIPFARIVGESGIVYAIDFDSKAISKLMKRAKKEGLDTIIRAEATSAAKIDFIPDHSVDFVFSNGLLCCMADHKGAISQMKRILKPSGSTYLSVEKLVRKRDPLSVDSKEWEEILSGFRVLERNNGISNRWAVVSPLDGFGVIHSDTEILEEKEKMR